MEWASSEGPFSDGGPFGEVTQNDPKNVVGLTATSTTTSATGLGLGVARRFLAYPAWLHPHASRTGRHAHPRGEDVLQLGRAPARTSQQ